MEDQTISEERNCPDQRTHVVHENHVEKVTIVLTIQIEQHIQEVRVVAEVNCVQMHVLIHISSESDQIHHY